VGRLRDKIEELLAKAIAVTALAAAVSIGTFQLLYQRVAK